jgi:hypothetical protein
MGGGAGSWAGAGQQLLPVVLLAPQLLITLGRVARAVRILVLTRLHIGIHGSVPPDPWVYASAYTRAYCAQGALLGAKKKTSPTLELNPMHGQKLKQFSPQPEVGNSPWITHL